MNFLHGGFGYQVDGIDVPVPGSASRVEEERLGMFTAATWTPVPAWTAETALRWERSALHNLTGGRHTERIADVLPKATLTWMPAPGSRVQGGVERQVGQLAFSQFLAAVQLTDEIVTAGAQALQPERSWNYALDYQRRFGERGLVDIGLQRQRIDNPIDVVVLDGGLQVTANVGPATIDTWNVGLTLPTNGIGVPGGLLTVNKTQARSHTTDPVTGEQREVSATPSSASLIFRQDLPGDVGAWGFSLSDAMDYTTYGVSQILRARSEVGGSVFGEWRPRETWLLRLTYSQGSQTRSDLWMYGGPRMAGQGSGQTYVGTTWSPATWQARLEWTPSPATRFEFSATTGGRTRIEGHSVLPTGETLERLTLAAGPTLSATVKLRW